MNNCGTSLAISTRIWTATWTSSAHLRYPSHVLTRTRIPIAGEQLRHLAGDFDENMDGDVDELCAIDDDECMVEYARFCETGSSAPLLEAVRRRRIISIIYMCSNSNIYIYIYIYV